MILLYGVRIIQENPPFFGIYKGNRTDPIPFLHSVPLIFHIQEKRWLQAWYPDSHFPGAGGFPSGNKSSIATRSAQQSAHLKAESALCHTDR